MPELRHRGHSFLRFRRRYLAVGATFFVSALLSTPTLPASAEVIHEEAVTVTLQKLSVSTVAVDPVVERGDFAITYFSLVQSPVIAGARNGKPFSAGHQGTDFLPGAGTPVMAIADGTVTVATNNDGSLGVHIEVQHVIDGETVTSTYSHMAVGSLTLKVGDVVSRGQQLGLVGSTGESTGPHLHFQILNAAGTSISPLPWLAAHINS